MRSFAGSLVAAAYALIALSSSAALWMFSRALDEMARIGGGIGALSHAMWQAGRLPLAAAWIAAIASVAAAAFAWRGHAWGRAPWTLYLAVASGAGAVLMFRGAMRITLDAALGYRAANVVPSTLFAAGAGAAVCFVIALALAIAATRYRAVPFAMIAAALVVSTLLIIDLSAWCRHWRGVALEGHPIASSARSAT